MTQNDSSSGKYAPPDAPTSPQTAPPAPPSSATPVSATAAPGVGGPAPAASAPAPATVTPPRQWLAGLGFALVAVIGVLIVLYAWRLPPFSSALISTENALVRGLVTIVGTQLSGYVVDVKVQDFQNVRRGDLLVLLDSRIYQQRVDQAKAQLAAQQAALANWAQQRHSAAATIALNEATVANAQAQAVRTVADLGRADQLVADGSLSIRERDQSRAAQAQTVAALAQARANLDISKQSLQSVLVNRQALEASVANAEAALKAAQVDLDNTRIVAPADGQLGQVTVRRGAFVNVGAQLMALVPQQMWVIANFKETQMNGVQVGQGATFKVDALGSATLTGQVERIAPATGSEFSVLPADNASGNFVKIAQRIPVRIRIDPGQAQAQRLRPGMSVVVSIDTSAVLSDAAGQPAPAAGAARP